MQRFVVLAYSIECYVISLVTVLYSIGFVTNFVVAKGIDGGTPARLTTALLIDGLLLALFAIQHSVMARPAFKQIWTRFVPPPAERSTYVLFTSFVLMLLFWQWRPLPRTVWDLHAPALRAAVWGICACGWGIVLVSTLLIDHFELFGVRQAYQNFMGWSDRPGTLKTVGLYRFVRHPLMTGFLIAFWATPTMSVGHLLFAATMTVYVLIAIQVEERELVTLFGDAYRDYRSRVGMLVPAIRRTKRS
jgi:methanethiol S-methyltransferase